VQDTRLLRRHRARGAHAETIRFGILVKAAREAKVDENGVATSPYRFQDDVTGLDVEVTVPGSVEGRQGSSHVEEGLASEGGRQRAVAQDGRERLARGALGDDEGQAVVEPVGDEGGEVGRRDRLQGAGFAKDAAVAEASLDAGLFDDDGRRGAACEDHADAVPFGQGPVDLESLIGDSRRENTVVLFVPHLHDRAPS
jgi:hypothetical protein